MVKKIARCSVCVVSTIALLCSGAQQPASAQQYEPFGEISKANQNSTLNMHLLPVPVDPEKSTGPVIFVDRLLVIASRRHMIQRPRILNA